MENDHEKTVSLICAAMILISLVSGCTENKTSAASTDETVPTKEVVETAAYKPKHSLSNPNADVNAQKVYDYICDSFGTYMLSCQQESTWMTSPDYEMEIIEEATGKLPAMRSLDFMNGDFDGVVEHSKAWHEKGGLVTICWHTGINGKGYNESRGDEPDFEKLLTPVLMNTMQ